MDDYSRWREKLHKWGIELSEMGEALRLQRNYSEARERFTQAERAYQRALDGSDDYPPLYWAIRCDMHINQARFRDESSTKNALEGLEGCRKELARRAENPSGQPQLWHQAAIAEAFCARLYAGRLLGFVGEPDWEQAEEHFNEAEWKFGRERDRTPDRERAYRSMLCQKAIALHELGNKQARRYEASKALASAIKYRDAKHIVRALAIWLLGRKGEAILRLWRYRYA